MTDAVTTWWGGEGASWEEAIGSFYDPEFDYYPVKKWPNSRPCHGRAELARFMDDFNEAWERSGWDVKEVTQLADDRVLMHVSLTGSGRGSGAELSGDVYFCFWLRNGLILRQEDHLTLEGARRGLGLGD